MNELKYNKYNLPSFLNTEYSFERLIGKSGVATLIGEGTLEVLDPITLHAWIVVFFPSLAFPSILFEQNEHCKQIVSFKVN